MNPSHPRTNGESRLLSAEADDFTLVATYNVESAEKGYDLVAALRQFAEQHLKKSVSFRSSLLHLSANCLQVLVYETWKDRGEYLAFMEDEAAKPHLERIKGLCLGVDAREFSVEAVVNGPLKSVEN